jgi:hypothetical protein
MLAAMLGRYGGSSPCELVVVAGWSPEIECVYRDGVRVEDGYSVYLDTPVYGEAPSRYPLTF